MCFGIFMILPQQSVETLNVSRCVSNIACFLLFIWKVPQNGKPVENGTQSEYEVSVRQVVLEEYIAVVYPVWN